MKKNMESTYNCIDKHKVESVRFGSATPSDCCSVFGVAFQLMVPGSYSAKSVCFAVPKYIVKGERRQSRPTNAVPHHRKLKPSIPLIADSKFFMFMFLVEELRLLSEDTTGELFCAALDILRSDPALASIV